VASDPVINLDELLAPIPGENPSGQNVRYESAYDAVREARRAEDALSQGVWVREAKTANYPQVIKLATKVLQEQSKDLQIAAWLGEALLKTHGFPGVRDDLKLLRELIERFWEGLYPQIDEGDLGSRAAPLEWVDRQFAIELKSIPFTEGLNAERYSWWKYDESQKFIVPDKVDGLEYDEAARVKTVEETALTEGKITSRQFREAKNATPRAFYETLYDDLSASREELTLLETLVDAKFGRDAPSFSGLRKSFEDCLSLAKDLLKEKREREPGPARVETQPVQEIPVIEHAAKPTVAPPSPPSGPQTPQYRLAALAAELRSGQAASPVSYLILRAARWGELRAADYPFETTLLVAPPSEVRKRLKSLFTNDEWEKILEESEQAMAREEGRAWLDLQRYSIVALNNLGHERAATAIRSELRSLLTDFAELPQAELLDGTLAANPDTLRWLQSEVLLPNSSGQPGALNSTPLTGSGGSPMTGVDGEENAGSWVEALQCVKSGRLSEGLDMLRREALSAPSGRERFYRKLRMAELCLAAHKPLLAIPILEELAQTMDRFRLEEWESNEWNVRVLIALYGSLRETESTRDGQGERIKQVFDHLCRLDISQALRYGEK
jgi:type VI secretion system protein ImpA